MQKINIEKKKLSEILCQHLENQIVSGELEMGSSLPPERKLMEIFNVGRPAVREAIFLLEKKGLIKTRNGMPAIITQPNMDSILEGLSGIAKIMLLDIKGREKLYDARVFLEAGLVREAAKMADKKFMKELSQALEINKGHIGDKDAFQRSDLQFHHKIAEIKQNPIFPYIREVINIWMSEQSYKTLDLIEQHEIAYQYHQNIYQAIDDKNADKAEQLMREHLAQSYAIYAGKEKT